VPSKSYLRINDITEEIAFKTLWLRRNRGVLTKVARSLEPPVGPFFVRQVFWGRRRSERVEAALAALGIIVGPPVRRRNVKAA
jgi:hypothetical protein